MSSIQQLDDIECALIKCLKTLCRRTPFQGVSLWKGWGTFVFKNETGEFIPDHKEAPLIDVMTNQSRPDDEDNTREVTVRVVLYGCENDGADKHTAREKIIDELMCGKARKELRKSAGVLYEEIRWDITRYIDEEAYFVTEWTASAMVADCCHIC